ncbi:MAG: hypothetical protein A2Y88_13680 [Chloroflexi bacterium RBG_13_48_10]|nr:MAG: hypothetical protein A2Y88_13680 [Chloroflexi bacterium RBG_13_48_10]
MSSEIVQPGKPRKWYEIWWDIFSHPGLAPFQSILNEPGHDITRGLIWVAVTSFIVTLVSFLFSALMIRNLMADYFGSMMFENYGGYTLYYLCSVILYPFFAILGIAITAGIYHWIAKLFHGKGNWDDLVFCLSAVTAPGTLVGGVIGIFSLLLFKTPVLIFLPTMVSLAFAIYIIVLNVNAIKAVEDIGTWEAIGTMFIPAFVVGVLVVCCSILILIPIFSQTISGQ